MMIRRIMICGFPFFLVLLEIILRKALEVDSYAFLGPTLAGIGIGFTIQLTKLKEISSKFRTSTQKVIRGKEAVTYFKADIQFVGIVCIILVLMVAGWYYSLYCSIVSPLKVVYRVPLPLGLGVLIYVVGVILSVIKDNIYDLKDTK